MSANEFDRLLEETNSRKCRNLLLWSSHIESIPSEIFDLEGLRELTISVNSWQGLIDPCIITDDYELVRRFFPGKETIYQIHAFPDKLSTQLAKLGYLERLQIVAFDQSDTKVINVIDLEKRISNLINLVSLHLSNCKLSQFPLEILKLRNLTRLRIQNCNITDVPREIYTLENLFSLDLRDNHIRELPKEIALMPRLSYLRVENNELAVPPEILQRDDAAKAILNYFISLFKGATLDSAEAQVGRQLNEIKLLIVGQGSVGKTSMLNRIVYDKYNSEETKTEGISINQWQLDRSGGSEIERPEEPNDMKFDSQESSLDFPTKLNIWDFGGQEIMHATHQFFLTKRSLYLLVLDSRLTQEENRVEYWLKIIQSFGGGSPVLIVGNKIDQHPLDIDRTGLQKKYPNIVGILETSAATGAGINELKAAITEQVNNLPHVRDLLPETWFTVKITLEELGKQSNFITHDKYLELCNENEVSDETSQRTLIGFLHDLGVVLHFQDDPRLEALGILNPQWVTNGVYKILNSHALFQNKGVLTVSMLDEILNLPDYPRGKRLFIVDMMKKFELCYDIEPDKSFLVPDLLPKDQPELIFNGIPAFEYAYPVLPSSVITRFFVRMNQHICDGGVWRTGVLLKIGENTALVKADIEDRKITIAIDGVEHTRRDALSAIRYQLDEIHGSIKGLEPQKRVPIPEAPEAEPLDYDYLLQLERDGFEEHPVKNGNRLVRVNVRKLLSGVVSEAERRKTEGNVTNIYVGGNFDGNLTVGDHNQATTNRIVESIKKAEASSLPPELMETLKLLGEAVDLMNKVLPKEQAIETTDDFGKLVDEATKPTPQKKWYSVSIEGLIKVAENVEKVGEPVIRLSRNILSLLGR